jgi:hypothetical protein
LFVANETQTYPHNFVVTATSPFCLKENSGANAAVVTAADFYLKATSTTTTTTLEFYDEDPATLKPRTLLATASVTLVAGVGGWYGGVFTPPVPILPNTNYFIGVNLQGGIQPGLIANGPGVKSTPHWWNKAAGWTGPFASYGWKYRVYGGSHAGLVASYGTGKIGSGGATPLLMGQGWPNTGNLFSLNLSGALHGAPAVLMLGVRANIPFSFGTAYVFPIALTLTGTTLGTAPGAGYLLTDLPIPVNPALHLAKVAFQSWIVDAGAADSLSNSNGVEITIGH